MARTKSSGSYTSEAVASVAAKMKSLAEAESQGSFHSKGREDILTSTIGTPEHPGRVRTAGRGMGFTKVFGRQSRIKPSTQMELEAIRTEMRHEMRNELMQELSHMFKNYKSEFQAQMTDTTIQQSEPSPRDTARVSTKGSCLPETEEDEPNKPEPELDVLNCMGHHVYDLPNGSVQLPLDHDEKLEIFYIFSKDLTDMSHLESFWCANQHLQLWSSAMEKYGGGGIKPDWNLIPGPYQDNSWACGFYVMKAMLDIVTLRITSSWGMLFKEQGKDPYNYDDLLDLRTRWAKFFLIKMEENKANKKPSRRRRAREHK